MKQDPPSREEAIRLMSQHPNLIRRPILIKDGEFIFGWDAKRYAELVE